MQSTTDPILLLETLGDVRVSTSEQIVVRRDSLLVLAKHLPVITDADTANRAVSLMRDIKTLTTLVEDARKAVKAPVLELAAKIDARAKELTGQLTDAGIRIGRDVGQWNAAQEELKRKAEIAAQEETSRIMREANEKIAHAQEHSRTPESAAAKIEKIEGKAMDEVAATREALVQPYADKKTTGTATRTVIDYEVDDIQAFYKAMPMMCDIKPKDGILKSYLKDLKPGTTVPGIRFWKSAATSIRG